MAQFYTLEEAARVLGMGPDELAQKAQNREVRGFMDGGTWQFRTSDVDELARRLGQGSDADLSLSDLDVPAVRSADVDAGDDFDLSDFHLDPVDDAPSSAGEHEILLDEATLPPPPVGKSSSTILGPDPATEAPSSSGGIFPGASDISLSPVDSVVSPSPAAPTAKAVSDSDVSLAPAGPSPGPGGSNIRLVPSSSGLSDSDVTLFHEGSSSDTGLGLTPAPGSPRVVHPPGSSAEIRAAGQPTEAYDEDSDFELSASGSLPDEGSDFELTALDSVDDFDVTPRSPAASDITGFLPSASGIDLARPSDSGINLQGSSGLNPHLSGLSRSPGPKATPASDLLSATSLPSPGEKNLFDDTDFEVDAIDSDDGRTVQLDAASDFDLDEAGSDHTSEVFAVDEDNVDVNAATALGASPAGLSSSSGGVAADWSDDSSAAAGALRPRGGEREESVAVAAVEDDSTVAPAVRLSSASAAPAEWGGLWVGLLGVATITTAILAFVCMDLALNVRAGRGGAGYYGLAKQLAGMLGS